MTQRTALHARVSTTRQQEGRTVASQMAALEKAAEDMGLLVLAEHRYVDEGYSGSRLDRPGLDALRDAAADEVAKKNLKKGQPFELSVLDRLQGQAKRLSRLVVDLLDVARLERGVLTLHRAHADMVSLISVCVEEFRAQAPQRRFVWVEPEQPIEIEVDSVRINQVISNLLDNAVKYTAEDRPVEVSVNLLPDRISEPLSACSPSTTGPMGKI